MGSVVQSDTEIINMALDLLTEAPIENFETDNRTVARFMRRNYPTVRDAIMRRHPWNFAVKRAEISADAEPPAYEYSYRYALPEKTLRILPLTECGSQNGRPIIFEVESGFILTNKSAPLRVRYIWRNDKPNEYDPNFIVALTHMLAMRAAMFMTNKASFAKDLSAPLTQALAEAQLLDSLEGSPAEPADDDIIRAR